MTFHPSHFDTARYFVSYSQSNSTLRISATALSSRQATIRSFSRSNIHHIQDMSTGYPTGGGLRNGFGRNQTTNHVQLSHIDVNRSLAYPNTLINNEGECNTVSMSIMPNITQGTLPTRDVILNSPMLAPMYNDGRRRRSSALSPRSTLTPFSNPFPFSGPGFPTAPSSSSFANHVAQSLPEGESQAQGFRHPSVPTISSISRTSTVSTENLSSPHAYSQHEIFILLSEVCTEALRRKWHDNIQREHIRSLGMRRSRQPPHCQHSRERFSPYSVTAHTNPHLPCSRWMMRARSSVRTQQEQQPLRFMELMQRVATVMWEDAKLEEQQRNELEQEQQQQQQQYQQHAQDVRAGHPVSRARLSMIPLRTTLPLRPATTGVAETAAIQSMSRLYSLGNSIMRAAVAVEGGESFNEDELSDIVGVAAGFCQDLGYMEGAERCEEVGRRPFGCDDDGDAAGRC